LLLLLSVLVQGQAPQPIADEKPDTASIAGLIVRADTSEALKGATVSIWNDDGSAQYSVRSDEEGRFRIQNVRAGRYRMGVMRQGYLQTY
jgi:uncharacterized surface anchored protein